MGFGTYVKKAKNTYYWWLDKLNKPAYIRSYPKYLRSLGIKIDENPGDCWISPTTFFDSTDYSMISIGRNVTVSFDVCFLVHDYSVNTSLRALGKRDEDSFHKMIMKPIFVGDNCFIGARAFIMPGATIGNDCIVGACSVVTGVIPDGSIVAGNPAKIIGQTTALAAKYIGTTNIRDDSR